MGQNHTRVFVPPFADPFVAMFRELDRRFRPEIKQKAEANQDETGHGLAQRHKRSDEKDRDGEKGARVHKVTGAR